jgi:hypothetical protein
MGKNMFTVASAKEIVGGLSLTEKMPGFSYGLPALKCKTGGRVSKICNSVCESCYGKKGRYGFPNIINAQLRRAATLKDPRWVDAMTFLIKYYYKHPPKNRDTKYFRWHDTGDIQSLDHLRKIIQVCENCGPEIRFRLPTRELDIVHHWMVAGGRIPENLVMRISGNMIDQKPLHTFGLPFSTVSYKKEYRARATKICPAGRWQHTCGECRACWFKSTKHVDYKQH